MPSARNFPKPDSPPWNGQPGILCYRDTQGLRVGVALPGISVCVTPGAPPACVSAGSFVELFDPVRVDLQGLFHTTLREGTLSWVSNTGLTSGGMPGLTWGSWAHDPSCAPAPGTVPLLPTRAPGSHCSGISLLQVQIGCHTDDLTRASKLFRGPLVINRCCLDKPTKSITCLWGGLLYIIVPQSSKLGTVPVTVKGAVHAPYYKLGEWTPWSEPRGTWRAAGEEALWGCLV